MLEKMKGMSLAQKADYIWEYYKIHILLTLLVVFIIGSVINTMYINPPKQAYITIAFFGEYINDEDTTQLLNTLNTALLPSNKTKPELECRLVVVPTNEGLSQIAMAMQQKFTAMVAARDIDFIAGEMKLLENYINNEYFISLDSLQEGLEGKCLNISQNKALAQLNSSGKEIFLGVVNKEDRLENVKKAFSFFLENQ